MKRFLFVLTLFLAGMAAANPAEEKQRRIFISIDASGSMLNGLTSGLLQDIRMIVRNVVLEGRFEAPPGASVLFEKTLVFQGKPLLGREDQFWVLHYGTTLSPKVVAATSSEQSRMLDQLPDPAGDFRGFFKEKDSYIYLPEMYVLKEYAGNPLYDYFWLDISDTVLDTGVAKIPQQSVKEWDALHEGVRLFTVYRARLGNGIYLTLSKVAEDTDLRLKLTTSTNLNMVALTQTNHAPGSGTAPSGTMWASHPFSIRVESGSMPAIRVQKIELQGFDQQGNKILLSVPGADQHSLEKLVLRGTATSNQIAALVESKNNMVRMVYYNEQGREMRHIFRNVSVRLSMEPDPVPGDFPWWILLLLILGGIGYFVWKKYDDGKPVRLVFSLSGSPDPRPMSLELVRGEKVAFTHETANTAGCQLYAAPGIPDCFITVQEVRRGRVRVGFTNLLDPALNLTARSLPLELELQNTTGKIFTINIEEEN